MLNRAAYGVGLFALVLALARCGSPPSVANNQGGPNESSGGTQSSGGSHGGNGPNLGVGNDGNDGGTDNGPSGDGGCSGASCDTPNKAVCGDGVLDPGEGCDDGNHKASDGCSADCKVQKDFECKTPGEACVSTVVCGDAQVAGNESCDDGNHKAADGCDDSCQIEDGWGCESGKNGISVCMQVAKTECGDGIRTATEACDDGNAIATDGCTETCTISTGYSCPEAGQPCVLDTVDLCGNGVLNVMEQCDDGNTQIGDGCNAFCSLEAYSSCPTPGSPCVSTIVCGDSNVVGDEACDDGNTVGNDGCAADCKSSEPGYTCPTALGVGGTCTKAEAGSCGDGVLNAAQGEYCDDGNTTASDGCTGCSVDVGYTCPTPATLCKLIESCGDGKLSVALGEQCDDGNAVGQDGCSQQCVLEANYTCPTPGTKCTSTVKCGDKKVTGSETCDDGNVVDGPTADKQDGCSATCQVESGWTCPAGGVCHATKCGDGIRAGFEACDDKGAVTPGCDATCQLEPGYKCDPDPTGTPKNVDKCSVTTCGDGKPEGTEQCDNDTTKTPFDGCSPSCTNEPKCGYTNNVYGCTAQCGDGMIFGTETCDDGNIIDGDGCDHLCAKEPGFTCTNSLPTLPKPLVLPIIYRDFNPAHTPNPQANHTVLAGDPAPQFEIEPAADGRRPGIAASAIGTDGKPDYSSTYGGLTLNGLNPAGAATAPTLTNATAIGNAYKTWYTNVANVNSPIVSTLSIPWSDADTAYVYDDTAFFPLDGKGFGNTAGYTHNYHFTSELRYWFAYAGNEKLEFRGDDDVWVFVNGQLVVDLGGIHNPLTGSITLKGAASQSCAQDSTTGAANCTTINVPLTVGTVYEIVLFQAERHVTGSNYKLTLRGFNAPRSVCTPVCGDGIVTKDEACDLKTANNTGAYGTCNADCTLPANCGDGTKNGPEQCDDGTNLSTYGGIKTLVCGPGCLYAPYCGDSKVDGANGEACDQGADNGKGYGYCLSNCQLGPRCGDGTKNGTEQCDAGSKNGTTTSACQVDCKLKCGNGTVDAGEACDDGAANNTGGYGKCNANCTLGARCGDGVKNGSEECDDGKNDGSYGYCAPGCVRGPRCGDSVVQSSAGEVCDLGPANSSSSYGKNLCNTRCLPAPYCGDHKLQAGEGCDDGVNSGDAGSCTTDCKSYVNLASCGDGVVKAPEQCDKGAANGTAGGTCDKHCKNTCGNGVVDAGETCDDGVNSGAYGTCTTTCGFAGFCGDGTKNGPEQCDLGDGVNEANPYGAGKCSTSCTKAPYCGDGYLQAGEQCDGSANCDKNCQTIVPH